MNTENIKIKIRRRNMLFLPTWFIILFGNFFYATVDENSVIYRNFRSDSVIWNHIIQVPQIVSSVNLSYVNLCPVFFRRGNIAQKLQYQLKNTLLFLVEIILWRDQHFWLSCIIRLQNAFKQLVIIWELQEFPANKSPFQKIRSLIGNTSSHESNRSLQDLIDIESRIN